MKLLNKIMILGSMAFAMTACVDQEPDFQVFPNPDVDFTYEVIGDSVYAIDYYVVSEIQFINTSAKQGSIKWNFGTTEYSLTKGTETSDTVVVKFDNAGDYKVTLTIDDEYSCTYPILIYDIVPRLSIIDNPMVLLGETKVDFDVRLPNPGKKPIKYTWTFPDGALDANGEPITVWEFTTDSTGVVECPQGISFSHIGTQQVFVDAIYDYGNKQPKGERALETSVFNVQVASQVPAPTLYYAQIGGNVKALKLVDLSELPKGTKVYPYDLGVRAGENPFTLLYGSVNEVNNETGVSNTTHWIYIIDAGKQYYYINDVSGTQGDGKITAMRTDGTNVNTVVTNVGGPAFSDPYQGCIYDGYIYYTDRNQGFSRVKMTERGLKQENVLSGETYLRKDYIAKNDLIPYYSRPIAYGAISVGLYRDKNNVWWWGKNYNGPGLFLFKDTDIYETSAQALAAGAKGLPYTINMNGDKFYCFTVDEKNSKIYAWYGEGNSLGEGLAQFELPAELPIPSNKDNADWPKGKVVAKMDAKHGNTTDSEKTFVKQLAVDEETGKVYFGFRKDEGDKSGVNQGIAVYDPATGKVSNYGETNDEIYGVVINPNKTQLF